MRFFLPAPAYEIGENEPEQFLRDSVRNVPHRAPCRRLNKAGHVEPLEPMMAECNWPLALRCPHAARDRLQADAATTTVAPINQRQ
jgi:hypothetical protein